MTRQSGRNRISWKLAICSASAVLCVASSLRADDAQDAVDLLTLAMKCPIKPLRGSSDTSDIFEHYTYNFTGTTSIFRFYGVTKDGEGNTQKWSEEARFADLKSLKIEPGYEYFGKYPSFQPPELTLFCSGDRECTKVNNKKSNKRTRFYVCDDKAAEDAKLAIDTLINLTRASD
jgi:hypothetical protein